MAFSVNEYIYSLNSATAERVQNTTTKLPYPELLERVRSIISENYADQLAKVVTDQQAEGLLRDTIRRIVTSRHLNSDEAANVSDLVDRLYDDMAGFSFISSYLADPAVEEININGADGVWVLYNGHKTRAEERFACGNDCLNLIRKMTAAGGNIILDGSNPLGDSFICRGVRISAAIKPCVDEDIQAIASIRKQQADIVTREMLINSDTYSEEEMEFLETCLASGVSVGVCGGVGSGKTSDLSLFLKRIPYDKRIVTIEDTRELNLIVWDEKGLMANDVVHLLTHEGNKPVTMQQLTKACLRFGPDYIVPAEMRGIEALDVANAGITGHTIASTLHADGAEAAYDRILAMCMPATHLSEERMLKIIVEAFPIMVYKERLPDGSRRMMEIFEATGVKLGADGRTVVVDGQYLFRYLVYDYERNEAGKPIKVIGEHKKLNGLSQRQAEVWQKKGVSREVIARFMSVDGRPALGMGSASMPIQARSEGC